MSPARLRVLHAIHDFLPRHQAGSEIYAFDLCRELARRHHVSVLCAEYDPSRQHGQVTWRVQDGLPVIEVVNNWVCRSFADSYKSPLITEQIAQMIPSLQIEGDATSLNPPAGKAVTPATSAQMRRSQPRVHQRQTRQYASYQNLQ